MCGKEPPCLHRLHVLRGRIKCCKLCARVLMVWDICRLHVNKLQCLPVGTTSSWPHVSLVHMHMDMQTCRKQLGMLALCLVGLLPC